MDRAKKDPKKDRQSPKVILFCADHISTMKNTQKPITHRQIQKQQKREYQKFVRFMRNTTTK